MAMTWAAYFALITNVFVLPFGNDMLAGLVLMLAAIMVIGSMGLGLDAAILVGGGFFLLLSITLLSIDLTGTIVVLLAVVAAFAILRLFRK